jgi:4-diphosphocytidyl-2-C-methyl-D-erythritol kinase
MSVTVRSFAKINLGLCIGPLRSDGFHDLRTIYQTIALHDVIRVHVIRGTGIEIRCKDPRVPKDQSNTCYRIVEPAMAAMWAKGGVVIKIDKKLPVQGGLGGGSANAVAVLLALERLFKRQLTAGEKRRIAADVGSDLPLFLHGGTVLGMGHGEQVYPLPDLPSVACVIATPEISISTPQAFADWDSLEASAKDNGKRAATPSKSARLTGSHPSDRMMTCFRRFSALLNGLSQNKIRTGKDLSGVLVPRGRGRAENPLLDLVRTGIENDFERVVFPQYPELIKVKRVLEDAGAFYASLSGSGSAIYGLFASKPSAAKAAARLRKGGTPAVATTTLTRQQYWKKIFD